MHAEKAYSLDPENPDAIVIKCIQYYLKGDTERFLELIQKALDVNPNHPRSLQMYSMSLMRQNKFDEAKEIYNKIKPQDLKSFLLYSYTFPAIV